MLWFQKKGSSFIIILLLVLFLPSIFSLLRPGFFLSDDGEWMVIRFSAFHQVLVDGQIPARFLSRLNNEYGYTVANFLYPGFMYLAEIPKAIGFGFVDSVKIVLGLSMLGSGLFTFFWLSKQFDRFSAAIGAFVYVYSPYHLFDLFKRGSVGEMLALTVLPFVFWQIERGSVFWSSIGIGFLILSHNTLALLFAPLVALYMLLCVTVVKKKRELVYTYIRTLVIGTGLSAFFWIPAVYDLQYTVFSKTTVSDFRQHFIHFDLVGLSTSAIFLGAASLFFLGKVKVKEHTLTILLFLIGIAALVLASPISGNIWGVLPVTFIQFPFRFLSVTLVATPFLAAFLISSISGKMRLGAGIALVLLAFFSSKQFMTPVAYFDKGEGFYATNMGTTTVQNEYMPKWVESLPADRPKEVVEIVKGEGKVTDLTVGGKETVFTVGMQQEGVARVNKVFFPGWQVFVNGEEVSISYKNDKGVMDIPVSSGEQRVLATFGETPVRVVSDITSLGSLVVLCFLSFKRNGKSS